jgi:hypothetical protein
MEDLPSAHLRKHVINDHTKLVYCQLVPYADAVPGLPQTHLVRIIVSLGVISQLSDDGTHLQQA